MCSGCVVAGVRESPHQRLHADEEDHGDLAGGQARHHGHLQRAALGRDTAGPRSLPAQTRTVITLKY